MSEKVILPTSLEGVANSIQSTLIDIWSNFIGHTPYLVGAIVCLFVTWGIAKSVEKLGDRIFSKSKIRRSLQELIIRLITIAIWLFGLLLAAMIVFPGLTPSKALGGLGLLSVAIGFAFKDIFENFFAGVLLLWRYPFENGDFIECEGIEGRILRTEIRMTQIRKTTGELIVVPNSFLFKNPVNVLTNLPKRRITFITGIAYSEDVTNAVGVIKKAVKNSGSVSKDEPVEIYPQSFGSSSIDIEVTWWTDPKPVDFRRSRGEVVTAVKKALDNAGIEIPFPYRTLTFKKPLEVKTGIESENAE